MVFEIAMTILLPIALSMGYAFKSHNEELMKYQNEEQKEYYQFVKENWMYINNDDRSKNQ